MNKVDRLEQEIKRAHIDMALEAGTDTASAAKSADELARSIRSYAKAINSKPSAAEIAYQDQIDRWYASSKVCESDVASQIEWLKKNGDAQTLHEIAAWLNFDDDLELARWIFAQSRTSKSSACLQVIAFVASGSVGYRNEADLLAGTIAKRIRQGFYKGQAGLERRAITTNDRELFLENLDRIPDQSAWRLPETAFGPFPVISGQESRFVFEGGEIRISLNEWKRDAR